MNSLTKYLPYLKTAGLIIGLAIVGYILFDGILGLLAGIGGVFFHGKSKGEQADDDIVRADEHKKIADDLAVHAREDMKKADQQRDELTKLADEITEPKDKPKTGRTRKHFTVN